VKNVTEVMVLLTGSRPVTGMEAAAQVRMEQSCFTLQC